MRRFVLTASAVIAMSLANAPASRAQTSPSKPAAEVRCSIEVGDHLLFDGVCLEETHSDGRVDLSEPGAVGYRFSFQLKGYVDDVYWNGERNAKAPDISLGQSQWLEGCWRSLPPSPVPFTVCLRPKT